MHLEAVSSGAKAPGNEDWAAGLRTAQGADLIFIDGATSVAERHYIDAVQGDVSWFVECFATALRAQIGAGLGQENAIHAAVEAAYVEFRERGGGREIPLYAWPIAALSWVRVREAGDRHRLELYCLGDCKILMRTPDGTIRDLDPFVNPQEAVVRAEVQKLKAEGIDDAAIRFARLLPMLRARREFQNTAPQTNSLCLRPNGALGARSYVLDALHGSAILVMSDGFYRLVDTYHLHTPASLFALCMADGLQAALAELRAHELAAASTAAVVKAADDASAVLWCPDTRD